MLKRFLYLRRRCKRYFCEKMNFRIRFTIRRIYEERCSICEYKNNPANDLNTTTLKCAAQWKTRAWISSRFPYKRPWIERTSPYGGDDVTTRERKLSYFRNRFRQSEMHSLSAPTRGPELWRKGSELKISASEFVVDGQSFFANFVEQPSVLVSVTYACDNYLYELNFVFCFNRCVSNAQHLEIDGFFSWCSFQQWKSWILKFKFLNLTWIAVFSFSQSCSLCLYLIEFPFFLISVLARSSQFDKRTIKEIKIQVVI